MPSSINSLNEAIPFILVDCQNLFYYIKFIWPFIDKDVLESK